MLSLRKRLLSGGLWAFIGKVFISLSTLIINSILARLLLPEDLGLYFTLFNIIIFCSSFGNFGLHQAAIKFLAQYLDKNNIEVLKRIIYIIFILVVIGLSLLCVVFLIITKIHSFDKVPLIHQYSIYLCIWTIAYILQQVISEIFRGFHDIKNSSAFGGVISGILFLFLLYLLHIINESSLNFILVSNIISLLISNFWGLLKIRKKIRQEYKLYSHSDRYNSEIDAKSILKVSMPLMLTSVTWFLLTQSDIWLLNLFTDSKIVAIYGATVKLASLITMPLFIVQMVVTPIIVELYAKKDLANLENILRMTSTFAFLPSLLLFIIYVFEGKLILNIMFGSYYVNGYKVLLILSLNQLLDVFFGSTSLVLSMTGHQKLMMKITFCISALTLMLNIIFVSRWGMYGIATSMTIGLFLMNFILVIVNYRKMNIYTHADLRIRNLYNSIAKIIYK